MDSVAATTAAAAAAAAGGCAATEVTDLQDPDALVCEIIELQMDMDGKGIDCTCLKLFAANIIKELPSLSPEVSVKKLRNILEVMKKKNNMQAREQTRRQSGPMGTLPGNALSAAGTKTAASGSDYDKIETLVSRLHRFVCLSCTGVSPSPVL